jgi:plastocyanin
MPSLSGQAASQCCVGPNSPETVDAAPGDVIEFNFRARAHSVTQSSFGDLCAGIDSGFKAGLQVSAMDVGRAVLRQFVLPGAAVPFYFYRGGSTFCQQRTGFVFNAPKEGEQTFEKFQTAAVASL